jgi:hypothetical protein
LDDLHETGVSTSPPLGLRGVADSVYVSATINEVGIEETAIDAMLLDGSVGSTPPSLEQDAMVATARVRKKIRSEETRSAHIESSKPKSSS